LQSQGLAKALKEAGMSARAYPAEGKTHDKPAQVMFEFLDGLLKK